MTENEWAKTIVKMLRRCNALVLNTHGEQYQQPGWPDLYIAHSFYCGWIELKGVKTLLEPHQKKILKGLSARGVPAYIARYPNLIQNYEGVLLYKFESTGLALLQTLQRIEEVHYDVRNEK